MIRLKWLNCILITAVLFVPILNNACAGEAEKNLVWNIKTSKQMFYPGEPVLLTINIKNIGTQEEKVDFGWDGLEAFTIEITDSNNATVYKGAKIQVSGGISRKSFCDVPPGQISQKLIVLNRWCSTLLPMGKYHILCNIDYRLFSEDQKQPGTVVMKAGPIHKIQLGIDIQIIKMNEQKFKEILYNLASFEIKPEPNSVPEWWAKQELGKEMIALTDSNLAVPYQLGLLRINTPTWFGPDAINSLVKSGTLEAATGLVQIIEDPNVHKEDMKPNLIDGVYRLREKGKANIINATDAFVAKHSRPVISKPMD